MGLRIVLSRPAVDVVHKFSKPVESLALGYLAAALRLDGHEVVLHDAMLFDWSPEESVRRLLEAAPAIVGFTVTQNHFPDKLVELLALLERSSFEGIVLVGGHSVSFFPERILRLVARVDGVVSGEGEGTLRAIASAVAAGGDWRAIPGVTARDPSGAPLRHPPRRIEDLREMTWPARDLIPDVLQYDGLACISTSRGCYARCSFCSVPRFYGLSQNRPYAAGAWIARPVDDVANEMESLHERFALQELLIVDDEFFGGCDLGFDRARDFARTLVERRLPIRFALSCRAENARPEVLADLQRAGLVHVFIGLESGTAESLKLYGKGHTVDQNRRAVETVKSLGLSFQAGYMMFNTKSTIEDVQANLRFLRDIGECKPAVIHSGVDPHFGAPLVTKLERDGVLRDKGLRLAVEYGDPKVIAARAIAEMGFEAFQPYMTFLAGVRSSITWEWRRPVPERRATEEHVLDRFEAVVNECIAGVVVRAVDRLAEGEDCTEVTTQARRELSDALARLELSRALVIAHLDVTEGGARFWTQRQLIEREAACHP
jgi:radical SAM superfamily enzyme YgiQ (UPF0313 family)